MEISEKHIEQLAKDHFKKITDEFYLHYGIGPKTQNKKVYKAIRDVEEALNIEKRMIFASLEELNKESNPKKRDERFIDKLLRLYDEYFELVEEENFEKYYEKLMEVKKRFDEKYPKKIFEPKSGATPEQKAEVDRLKKESDFSEYHFKKGKEEMVKAKFNDENIVEYDDAVNYEDNIGANGGNKRFHFYIDMPNGIFRYSEKLNVSPDDYENMTPYININTSKKIFHFMEKAKPVDNDKVFRLLKKLKNSGSGEKES
jgi:hypothetical protein